jgi:hypothetical protein
VVWLGDGHGHRVCVHGAPTAVLAVPSDRQAGLWERAVEASLHGVPTTVPSAADHLLIAAVDGARAGSLARLRWITDAAALVGSGVDWTVVVGEAGRHAVTGQLAHALRYLRTGVGVGVPAEVLTTLSGTRRGSRERVAHRLSVTTAPGVPSGVEVVGRFLRLTADLPLRRAAAVAPRFLADQCGVRRPTEVPAAAARRVLRAVRSPSPPGGALPSVATLVPGTAMRAGKS